MTGLYDTDIRLDNHLQLTAATDGDAPICWDLDCLYQTICLEAVTQKGALFYAPEFGWSLLDFLQAEDDALTRLEIQQRALTGLAAWESILPDSIATAVSRSGEFFQLSCTFRFLDEAEDRELNLVIGAVNVEVIFNG